MKKPSLKTTKVLATLATPLAVVAAGGMVMQSSYAAFTGQTRSTGNEWSTGSVNLTDDDNGQARFAVADMLPGDTETKCVTVTAKASVPSTVKGYTLNAVNPAAELSRHLVVSVQPGQGGSYADCDGFRPVGAPVVHARTLADLATVTSFENGIGSWAVPEGTHTRTYRVTWAFDTAGMTQDEIDRLQGAETGIDLQWEMKTDSRD